MFFVKTLVLETWHIELVLQKHGANNFKKNPYVSFPDQRAVTI
jgi:hypothetical protein